MTDSTVRRRVKSNLQKEQRLFDLLIAQSQVPGGFHKHVVLKSLRAFRGLAHCSYISITRVALHEPELHKNSFAYISHISQLQLLISCFSTRTHEARLRLNRIIAST